MSGVTTERMMQARAERAEARVVELEAEVGRLVNALRRAKSRAAVHNDELGRLRSTLDDLPTGGWGDSAIVTRSENRTSSEQK